VDNSTVFGLYHLINRGRAKPKLAQRERKDPDGKTDGEQGESESLQSEHLAVG
jgi:hypothetical protein